MLPEEYLDLLDAPITAILASIGPDGMPHASPVWFTHDGEHLFVSTTNDRQKFRNVRDRPIASITIVDPDRPFHYLEVRADVALEDDPAFELRDRLAARYGIDPATLDPVGTVRVGMRLTPRQVIRR